MAQTTPEEDQHLMSVDVNDNHDVKAFIPEETTSKSASNCNKAMPKPVKNKKITKKIAKKSQTGSKRKTIGKQSTGSDAAMACDVDVDIDASVKCCDGSCGHFTCCSGCENDDCCWTEGSCMFRITSGCRVVFDDSRSKRILFLLILFAQLFVALAVVLDTLNDCEQEKYEVKLGMLTYHGDKIKETYYSEGHACAGSYKYTYYYDYNYGHRESSESCVEFQLRGYAWLLFVVFNWLEYISSLRLFRRGPIARQSRCCCGCCICKCCECCRPTFESEMARSLYTCIFYLSMSVIVWNVEADNIRINLSDIDYPFDCNIDGLGVSNWFLVVAIAALFLSRVYLGCIRSPTDNDGDDDRYRVKQQPDDAEQEDCVEDEAELELQQ